MSVALLAVLAHIRTLFTLGLVFWKYWNGNVILLEIIFFISKKLKSGQSDSSEENLLINCSALDHLQLQLKWFVESLPKYNMVKMWLQLSEDIVMCLMES